MAEPTNECPVCYEQILDECTLPSCTHKVCKRCLILMLQNQMEDLPCPMCRTLSYIFEIKLASGAKLFQAPTTIFKSIYIQGSTEGLASYHFESLENCYISYESPSCSEWPNLDDGSRPPPKKYFVNTSYNEESRTFKGDIVWHPTTWNGDALWKYTMVFSADFKTIESGGVQAFDNVENGNILHHNKFGVRLIYFRKFNYAVVE